jgi:hypothetical protein
MWGLIDVLFPILHLFIKWKKLESIFLEIVKNPSSMFQHQLQKQTSLLDGKTKKIILINKINFRNILSFL